MNRWLTSCARRRRSSTIVDDSNILVIGSQSVLASFDEEELPDAATASMEVDLAYFDDPAEDKADAVDGPRCCRRVGVAAWSPGQTPRAKVLGPQLAIPVPLSTIRLRIPTGWITHHIALLPDHCLWKVAQLVHCKPHQN